MVDLSLDLDDIQGDILRAYGNDYDCTSYLFVRIGDAVAGRGWLASLVPQVTTAAPWTAGKPDTTLNVAVNAAGVVALGLPPAVVASFAPEFRDGMAARAELLGDVGQSAPGRWDAGLRAGAAGVLVTVRAKTASQLGDHAAAVRAGLEGAGATVVHEQRAALLGGAREHFGFADGMAQPAIKGATDDKANGGGVPLNDGSWRALAPGEFILGYPDEDTLLDDQRRLPVAPVAPFGRNGTYMVWRKLRQDVALFRRAIGEAADGYRDGDAEKLAAKVVGRWRNGTPMETHPDGPDPAYDPSAAGANDFRYRSDADGRRCPVGAHIRRSNPRDALGFEGRRSLRQRMIRRGMPYGERLAEGVVEDDGVDRGLIFVSFQASLLRQFEGVQIPWLGDGNIFGLGTDRDYLLGDPSGGGLGKMTVQGDPPLFLAPHRPFVMLRGGDYFFVPGISALQALATTAAAAS